jgi:hypothetical protein
MRARATLAAICAAATATQASAAPPTAHQRQMAAVVHAWSARLDAGDNAGIAQLFSLPAIVAQPPYVYRFTTRKQIADWHAGLPCSGKILSIAYRGRFATAVFSLGNRGSHKCDAKPGTRVAARFEIVGGKIRSWVQVPVPKPKPGATA